MNTDKVHLLVDGSTPLDANQSQRDIAGLLDQRGMPAWSYIVVQPEAGKLIAQGQISAPTLDQLLDLIDSETRDRMLEASAHGHVRTISDNLQAHDQIGRWLMGPLPVGRMQ